MNKDTYPQGVSDMIDSVLVIMQEIEDGDLLTKVDPDLVEKERELAGDDLLMWWRYWQGLKCALRNCEWRKP